MPQTQAESADGAKSDSVKVTVRGRRRYQGRKEGKFVRAGSLHPRGAEDVLPLTGSRAVAQERTATRSSSPVERTLVDLKLNPFGHFTILFS